MTSTELARAAVAEAADAFMAELEEWTANYHSDLSTDIRGPLADIVAGLASVAADDRVATFERECFLLIDEHEMWLSAGGSNQYASMPPVRLAPVWAALDEALAPFDDELIATARRDVAAAETNLGELQQRLAAAVESADVEKVLELREAVEFSAPNRVADARARLREVEVTRSRTVLERSTRRWETAAAASDRATAVHAEAERALAVATVKLRLASERRLLPTRVHSEAQDRLRDAERRRDKEAATAKADKQSRLRQITGLMVQPPPSRTTSSNKATEQEQLQQLRASELARQELTASAVAEQRRIAAAGLT